jgi:integrase
MPIRKVREHVYDIDFIYRHPDGRRERIRQRFKGAKKHAFEEERRLLRALQEGAYNSNRKTAPELRKVAGDFLAKYAETNNKPSEVDSKRMILDKHILPALGKLRLDEITAQRIEDYKAAKLGEERPLKAKSINNHLSVLRTLLTEAAHQGLIESLPRFKWLKTDEPKFDFLTFDEALALRLNAAPWMWKAMITVALNTGMRLGELLGLDWDAIDLERRVVHVRQSYVRERLGTPKTHKTRDIPINQSAFEVLNVYAQESGPGAVFARDGERLTKGQCKHPLWRACKQAGIRRIGWHVLRHTFASHLVMCGVPLITVRDLMGHTTIKMTERYAHLAPDLRARAVGLLDELPLTSG